MAGKKRHLFQIDGQSHDGFVKMSTEAIEFSYIQNIA
jgi:hypothetical protein